MTETRILREVAADSELETVLACYGDNFGIEFLMNLDNFVEGRERFYDVLGLVKFEWIKEPARQAMVAEKEGGMRGAILQEVDNELILENYQVSESAEPIVKSVLNYFLAIVDKYDDSVFGSLFPEVLKAASFLPEDYRAKPLDQLLGLIDVDEKSNLATDNPYFVPRVVKEVLMPLLLEYNEKLGRLKDTDSSEYNIALEEFSSDLDEVVLKTRRKLELNRKYSTEADEISYAKWFPDKVETDFSILDANYIHTLEGGWESRC